MATYLILKNVNIIGRLSHFIDALKYPQGGGGASIERRENMLHMRSSSFCKILCHQNLLLSVKMYQTSV